MKTYTRLRGVIPLTMALALSTSLAHSATNSWIKPGDGKWEDSSNWSLAHAPNSAETVSIGSTSNNIVTIDQTTAAVAPLSFQLTNLNIVRSNTLLLNDPPTSAPFTVTRLELGPAGTIEQRGGKVEVTNLLMLNQASYVLTGGVFNAQTVEFVYPGSFVQQSGSSAVKAMSLYAGDFHLLGGTMKFEQVSLKSQFDRSQFRQQGGTNWISSLSLSSPAVGGFASHFELSNGSLRSHDVMIDARGTIAQSGGTHYVSNNLALHGDARFFPPQPIPATYSNAATLEVLNLEMNEFSRFLNRGATKVHETVMFKGGTSGLGELNLVAGSFTCRNVVLHSAPVDIHQSGGAFAVENLLCIGRHFSGGFNGAGARFARYTLAGGSLAASGISLEGEMVIADSLISPAITNNSFFIAGRLTVGNVDEQLGQLSLVSNSVIDLASSSCRIAFKESSEQLWSSQTALRIENWNGNLAGNGAEQLRIGTNQNGLNWYQLQKLQFIDPAGLPPGNYPAAILPTGEIVPGARPHLAVSSASSGIVLNWTDGMILQTSTNVAGPYVDLPGATHPYTNSFEDGLQRYFRLRVQ